MPQGGLSCPLGAIHLLPTSARVPTSCHTSRFSLSRCVEPDLKAKELKEKYGGATPAETVKAMLLPGEIEDLSRAVERLCGFRRITIDEVKNA